MKQLQDPLLVAVDSDIDIEKAVVVGPKSACRNLPPPIQGLHEILTGTKKHELFQMYPVRWFVLFVFCLVSFNQGMFWMTFAPISNLTVEYFHLQCNTSALLNSTTTAASTVDGCGGVDSAEAVAFLHLWGPMFSVFFLPIVSCVSRTSGSSRKLLVWAATLSIVSGILRVLPETPFLVSTSKDVIYVIHISQAINGCVGPFVWSIPSVISSKWFAQNERTTATGTIVCCHFLGLAAAFAVPTFATAPSDVGTLLWIEFGLSLLAFLTIFCIPAAPPTPPSGTAHVDSVGASQPISVHCASFCQDLSIFGKNTTAMCLSVLGGLSIGALCAWLAAVVPLATVDTLSYADQAKVSAVGVAFIGVGAIAVGPVLDRIVLAKQRAKALLVGTTISPSVIFFFLTVSLPLGKEVLISVPFGATIAGVLFGCGLFGAAVPVFYELVVESSFPLPPVLGGLLLTLWCSVGYLSIAVAAMVLSPSLSLCCTGAVGFFMLLLGLLSLFCKVSYHRLHQDASLTLSV